MVHKVFISYSSQDQKTAMAACAAIESRGIKCWIAPRDIQAGFDYADSIIDAINECRVFLVILSEHSNKSPQVAREVERAVSKNLHILTFRIDDAVLSKAMEYYLSNHHWVDASERSFKEQLDTLTSAVEKLIERVTLVTNNLESELHQPIALEKIEASLPQVVKDKIKQTTNDEENSQTSTITRKDKRIWIFLLVIILVAVLIIVLQKISQRTASIAQTEKTQETIAIWVNGFANPILKQIENKTPDFSEEFDNPSLTNWDFDPQYGSVVDGMMRISADHSYNGIWPQFSARDFVLEYDFEPIKWSSGDGQTGVGCHGIGLSFGLSSEPQSWWGFGSVDENNDYHPYSSGIADVAKVQRTTHVTVIVRGNQFAVFINGEPFTYLESAPFKTDDLNIYAGSEDSTIEVAIDNIKIWDLSKQH